MTYDNAWVAAEEAKRAWMDANSLYKAEDEHASCGVGLVVAISGKPSRKVVENGTGAPLMPMARPAMARASMCRFRSSSFTTKSAAQGTNPTPKS
jgi:hypothetical protein